ncbi:hypothetical protein D1871_08975 [Nakamurella silvestris]|nr:hypothetical protein D1871_08975 [Nakamurella silvestris]
MSSRSKLSLTPLLGALCAGSLLLLSACGDAENVDRDSTLTVVTTADSAAPTASEPVQTPLVATTAAPTWDLTAGPAAVAARIDQLSGQDAGISVAADGITVYIHGDHPAWLTELTTEATGSALKVTVKDAKYGQQYLLSAAQEILPQILPLGATSVRPAQDLSSLVILGPVAAADRKTITTLASGLKSPVEVTYGG